jgi:hypothetical protein
MNRITVLLYAVGFLFSAAFGILGFPVEDGIYRTSALVAYAGGILCLLVAVWLGQRELDRRQTPAQLRKNRRASIRFAILFLMVGAVGITATGFEEGAATFVFVVIPVSLWFLWKARRFRRRLEAIQNIDPAS